MGIQKTKEAVIRGCPILFFPCTLYPVPYAFYSSLVRPPTLLSQKRLLGSQNKILSFYFIKNQKSMSAFF